MSARLFHLVDRQTWRAAHATGAYRPDSLLAEGFVHCSYAEQVAAVANARYRGVATLCVVELDPALIPAEIRVEDSYGEGSAFPHVYGPVPTDAAVAIHDLDIGSDGSWRFNPGAASAAAASDR